MNLTDLAGVGKMKAGYLSKLNINSIGDLLSHFPRRYEDRRQCRSFLELIQNTEQQFPVAVKVLGYDYIIGKGKKTLKIIVSDGANRASLACFNRDYLKDKLEEGKDYIIFGEFQYKYNEIQSSRFEYIEKGAAIDSLNFLRIVPIYSLTEGIRQNFLREIIFETLESSRFEESLPASLIHKHKLISKKESFWQIHFPDSFESLQQAINRLKYYELFELETNVALKKYFFTHQRKKNYQPKSTAARSLIKQFIDTLPFKLTNGQNQAFQDIQRDLLSSYPMHRLIQGDVGSGKTLVAALAMFTAAANSYQTVIMVPTEILAKQHYQTLSDYAAPFQIQVDLLIGALKTSARKETLNRIKDKTAHIIVGTHALFSEDVEYANLSLIVIDEQHKFGVWERAKLVDKGESVDLLVMTATPIPRTLSLTVYGDMDVSIIPDKPAKRASIKSRCIFNDDKRRQMYQFLDTEIEKGRQAFVVCPLIEESEKLEAIAAEAVFAEINNDFLPHRKIALLHGRLSTDEKDSIMSAFLKKEYDILVSTSVIEVGVDVSNATVMVIENADRFGLSQLHQIRGRIGRGQHQSFCFFTVPTSITEDGKNRIRAIINHHDGFALAEEDLKIRGPGEFLGTKQSGLDSLKLANLIKDEAVLIKAQEDAFALVQSDPHFNKEENKILAKTIYRRFIDKHRFFLTN